MGAHEYELCWRGIVDLEFRLLPTGLTQSAPRGHHHLSHRSTTPKRPTIFSAAGAPFIIRDGQPLIDISLQIACGTWIDMPLCHNNKRLICVLGARGRCAASPDRRRSQLSPLIRNHNTAVNGNRGCLKSPRPRVGAVWVMGAQQVPAARWHVALCSCFQAPVKRRQPPGAAPTALHRGGRTCPL